MEIFVLKVGNICDVLWRKRKRENEEGVKGEKGMKNMCMTERPMKRTEEREGRVSTL